MLCLALTGPVSAGNAPQSAFAAYMAGVEMIVADKSLGPVEQARRYRKLCAITGISGDLAKAFLLRYKNDPAGWQKFETSVMELLQKKG